VTEGIARTSAHVVLIDELRRVLLMSARDPGDDLTVWFTPGGGVEAGESLEEAARRELFEEVDGPRDYDLAGPVWLRRWSGTWDGEPVDAIEWFFVARIRSSDVVAVAETGSGARYFKGWRWWTLSELERFEGILAPRRLAELLPPILGGDLPGSVIDTE
jgi:8-oxo-dGTP pyrophosphatase MutT (NUDIX family)